MNLDNWEIEFELKHRYRGCNERDYHEIKSFISKVASNAYTEGQLNAGVDVAKLVEKAREEGYERGQKHAFEVDRKVVFEEGRQSLIVEAIEWARKNREEWKDIPSNVVTRRAMQDFRDVITYLESLKKDL